MSRALGAMPSAVVSSAAEVERAKWSGAEVVVDLAEDDLRASVLRGTGGKGADLALDPVGGKVLGRSRSRSTRPGPGRT
ncbi:zinc-binding dehydrogenase [Stenotrophomonas tumulicola]|uniref:Zinc-binding dehydrogenase n=2 Tax=Stenotrophomonas tumulicola TaxID=1685415 RepID=A0A7W3FKV5_9GAMM|nr:zinc-binding dehydrogenase [Stenotrophomonas tumulicola]